MGFLQLRRQYQISHEVQQGAQRASRLVLGTSGLRALRRPRPRELRAFFSCMAWRAIPGPLSKRKSPLVLSLPAPRHTPPTPDHQVTVPAPDDKTPRLQGSHFCRSSSENNTPCPSQHPQRAMEAGRSKEHEKQHMPCALCPHCRQRNFQRKGKSPRGA